MFFHIQFYGFTRWAFVIMDQNYIQPTDTDPCLWHCGTEASLSCDLFYASMQH